MADLQMLGKVTREKSNFFFELPHLFYIGSVEKGDEEEFVSYDNGVNALESAMFLWDLINPQVRANYKNFRKNEIEIEQNHLDSGGYLVAVEQVKKLLEFINDIDKKVEMFVDADGRILPEYLNYIGERIYLPTLENGEKDLDRLRDDLGEARWIKFFLQEAVELNYPLVIG